MQIAPFATPSLWQITGGNNGNPAEVSTEELQKIINDYYHKGYAKRTLRLMKSTAKSILKLAQKDGKVSMLITDEVVIPRSAPTKKILPITLDQELLLWNVEAPSTDNKMDIYQAERLPIIRMWALLQLCCGLRRKEAAAMEWQDVDFLSDRIHIRQAYDFKTGKIKPPKSDAGDRYIYVPDRLVTELYNWRQQHPTAIYLFEMDNKIITEDKFRKLWNVLMDAINGVSVSDKIKAGCKGTTLTRQHHFTSHQLRHTYATNALDADVIIKALQYLMGNETPEMTLRYVGLTRRAMEDARSKMEQMYYVQNAGVGWSADSL